MKKITIFFMLNFAFSFLLSCNTNETKVSGEIPDVVPSSVSSVLKVQNPTPPPLREGAHSEIPDLTGAMVVVPDMVKGKWKGVTLMLEDKKTHEITEHTIDLGKEWSVPKTNLKVVIGTFLPDLIIQGKVFTSVSNELKNPAVHVRILEKGSELYKGWLFSLFPTMHSFQHDRYAITLKDVIAS